jgi:hypothetical protein
MIDQNEFIKMDRLPIVGAGDLFYGFLVCPAD